MRVDSRSFARTLNAFALIAALSILAVRPIHAGIPEPDAVMWGEARLNGVLIPGPGHFTPDLALFDIMLIFGHWADPQLKTPFIGSERKTHFPHRRRFFDPGVCSRSGWVVSS